MAICLATKDLLRAVSGTRTRDPQLGKLMLYQLSYYRITFISGAKIEFYCEIAKRNHIKYLFFAITPNNRHFPDEDILLCRSNYLRKLSQLTGMAYEVYHLFESILIKRSGHSHLEPVV